MFNTQQVIQDLRDTADYMREHPWLQGLNFDGKGGCCAFGALLLVTQEEAEKLSRRERSSNACRAFYRVIGHDITNYNDTRDRTQQEVIQALTTVADTIEKDPSRA